MPVYLIRAGATGPVKIGKADNPVGRLGELQVAHYETLFLIRVWEGGEAEEAAVQARFADLRIRGEWFSFSRLMMGDVGLVEVVPEPEPPAPMLVTGLDVIGINIKNLRLGAKITQAELASATGVARSSIAQIEIGRDLPGRSLLIAIATFFKVSIDSITGAVVEAA